MRKATDREVKNLDRLRMQAFLANQEYEITYARLKVSCDVPTWSTLDTSGAWCGPDRKPLFPDSADVIGEITAEQLQKAINGEDVAITKNPTGERQLELF